MSDYKIKIPSSIENIKLAERFIDEICIQFGIKDALYGDIFTAIIEAVNNAIRHGNKLNHKKLVYLSSRREQDIITFTIEDEGDGFDPLTVPNPTLSENIEKLNGRGVFLVNNLADKVAYKKDGRIVEITFFIN